MNEPDGRLLDNAPRRGQSFLFEIEQRRVRAVIAGLPEWVAPAHLSALGVAGAGLAAFGLIASHAWPWIVFLAPLGLGVNWFGFALDLPLGRLRRSETPRLHLAHHIAELFSNILLIMAYGFSPFLTFRAAAIILVCYLLFSAYTYIRAATRRVDQMAYIGIGATEFRLMLAFWPFAAVALGVPESLGDRLPAIDVAIIALAGIAGLGLVAKLFLDGRQIAAVPQRED